MAGPSFPALPGTTLNSRIETRLVDKAHAPAFIGSDGSSIRGKIVFVGRVGRRRVAIPALQART